jgi:hypothetical protein
VRIAAKLAEDPDARICQPRNVRKQTKTEQAREILGESLLGGRP